MPFTFIKKSITIQSIILSVCTSLILITPSYSQATVPAIPYNNCTQLGKHLVKVHYSKAPESNSNFSYTLPFSYCTTYPTPLLRAIFAINKISRSTNAVPAIATGLFIPLRTRINLPSTCNWANSYGINFNKDFYIQEFSNLRTIVKFCRPIASAGIGEDARVRNVIEKTLKEQSKAKVVIIDVNNNCYGDMSGLNLCKK